MSWLDGITSSVDMNVGKLGKRVKDREPRRASVHGEVGAEGGGKNQI